MLKNLLVVAFLALCPVLFAQQALNNEAIIKLVKAGMSDDFIVSTINVQPGNYDDSPNAIAALKNANASDRVMSAIVQKVGGATPISAPPASPLPIPDPGPSSVAPAKNATPPPATMVEPPQSAVTDKPRVFITDSESWETSGSAGGSNGSFAAQSHGGARPQTAEIIKTFGERCSEVIVNNRQAVADYVVVLDHEGGKGYLRHRNKVAVFEHVSGDVVMSKSTLSLGGSVEEACNGIIHHWAAHGKEILGGREKVDSPTQPTSVTAPLTPIVPLQAVSQASVLIDSTPAGADIEIDNAFVGNTPSSVSVPSGSHQIAVKKKGYIEWAKTLNVTGGTIHLNAELDQEPPKQ
jgi:hypothetical protein